MMTPPETGINETIIYHLEKEGWCVIPGFIQPTDVKSLAKLALKHLHEDEFHQAGIGNQGNHEINRDIRSDMIRWIDPTEKEFSAICGSRFEALRLAINQHLYLGLLDIETHFALYRPGAFYEKHLDQFRNSGRRKLTVILYLNREWSSADGGQLLLYTGGNRSDEHVEILPTGGTLVCFLSEEFPHEVLPSKRDRLSLTGWYRTRE
jgi:SM-20-related protein